MGRISLILPALGGIPVYNLGLKAIKSANVNKSGAHPGCSAAASCSCSYAPSMSKSLSLDTQQLDGPSARPQDRAVDQG